ncbi:MAG: hypothetical protein OXN96_13395 [Bryobacterales bacterium]|nr:hypothetical protein [Bryobacterales bacterium]
MGGLDPDGPAPAIVGEGATCGAEADLEAQYMPSSKLVLKLRERGTAA